LNRGQRVEQDYYSRKRYKQNYPQYVEKTDSEKRFEVPKREGTFSSSSSTPSTIQNGNDEPDSPIQAIETPLTSSNIESLAYNAIKYFELSQSRQSNYVFSFQEMLSIKGNSALYLIYAYVRIRAIRRMAQQLNVPLPSFDNEINHDTSTTDISQTQTMTNTTNNIEMWNLTKEERDLTVKLIQFPDVVRTVEETQQPHLLSLFLFQLTQNFHSFYESCRIFGHTQQNQRLKLCLNTENVLSKGLSLLNVTLLEYV
jgi:arginyl-tRNA synthetase